MDQTAVSIRVAVPDQVTKEWMEQEYAEDIRESDPRFGLPVERVIYTARAAGQRRNAVWATTQGTIGASPHPIPFSPRPPAS